MLETDEIPLTSQETELRLARLAGLARSAGLYDVAREASDLAGRVEEGRFHVACVGDPKRGKSTLVNALLGAPVLPTGVAVVPGIGATIRHGEALRVRVHFENEDSRDVSLEGLADFLTEQRNPANWLRVRAVEILAPSALLVGGMCLIDAPGRASVSAGDGAAMRSFLPHVDAALVVLGAEPPITSEELAVVEQLARRVRYMVFVLNKADRSSDEDLRDVASSTRRLVSRRIGRIVGPLHVVSALERLSTGRATRDWEAMERALVKLEAGSGAEAAARAQALGLDDLVHRALWIIDEGRGALTRGKDESRAHIEQLCRIVTGAELGVGDFGRLRDREHRRLVNDFDERRTQVAGRAVADSGVDFERVIQALPDAGDTARRALFIAQSLAREKLGAWIAEVQALAEREYREATVRLVEAANCLLGDLAARDPELAGVARLDPEARYRIPSRYVTVEALRSTIRSPWQWMAGQVRLRLGARRAIVREATRYIERIVEANSMLIRNDLADRLAESRRVTVAELRARLREVPAVAERAFGRAEVCRARGVVEVRAEVDHLDTLRSQIVALRRRPRAEALATTRTSDGPDG